MNPSDLCTQLARAKQQLKATLNYDAPSGRLITRTAVIFIGLGFVVLGAGICAMQQPQAVDQIAAICTTMGGVSSIALGGVFLIIIAIF